MAIKSGMFNSVGGDRRYKAEDFAAYFATFIGNGVFPNPSTGFQVLANGNMTVTLKLGKGWINGYYITNDDNFTLTIDPSDSALNRIDRVVLQLNYLNRAIAPVIKKGTPATTPVAPTPKRDADAYELVLADIAINKGALVLSQSNITDQRLNTALCGIVHGVVDQVDTTTIFNQYQSWYQNYTAAKATEFEVWMNDEKVGFDAWFATIRDVLDGDVAANLAARIQELRDNFNAHKNEKASLTAYGHTQLSSATNSESETLAATPKAVKTAMGRADAAFTSANNGKTAVANAVTAKGVTASPTDTFTVLAAKIGQINTGKKFASGTVTSSSVLSDFKTADGTSNNSVYSVTVSGLSFLPSLIIINTSGGATRKMAVYIKGSDGLYTDTVKTLAFSGTFQSNTVSNFKVNDGNAYVNNTGFKLPLEAASYSCSWIAIE